METQPPVFQSQKNVDFEIGTGTGTERPGRTKVCFSTTVTGKIDLIRTCTSGHSGYSCSDGSWAYLSISSEHFFKAEHRYLSIFLQLSIVIWAFFYNWAFISEHYFQSEHFHLSIIFHLSIFIWAFFCHLSIFIWPFYNLSIFIWAFFFSHEQYHLSFFSD